MKVLLVISKFIPEYSGPGFRLDNTYKRLLNIYPGLKLEVVCGGVEQRNFDVYDVNGTNVTRIQSRVFPGKGRVVKAIQSFREAFDVWRLLKTKSFDVLHVVGMTSLTATAIMFASRSNHSMLIELVNSNAIAKQTLPGFHRLWEPNVRQRVVVCVISEVLAQNCRNEGIFDNIWSRPNPVDTSRFYPDFKNRNKFRRNHSSFHDDDIVLTSVAKFMPRKNQIFLLEVLALLPEKYKLILAGPLIHKGPLVQRDLNYMNEIVNKIKNLHLEDRVLIKTQFVNTPEFIKLSDVYLMPAYHEGLGTPMLESIACGVPVVANEDEDAFRQWCDHGENGFLVPLKPEKWAAAIKKAVNIPSEKMEKMAKKIKFQAGSDVIDQQYKLILEALAKSSSKEVIKVSNVLKQLAE